MPDGGRICQDSTWGYDHVRGEYVNQLIATRPLTAFFKRVSQMFSPSPVMTAEAVESSVAGLSWNQARVTGERVADVSKFSPHQQIQIEKFLNANGVGSVDRVQNTANTGTAIHIAEADWPKVQDLIQRLSGKPDPAVAQPGTAPKAASPEGLYDRAVYESYGKVGNGYRFRSTGDGAIQFEHPFFEKTDIKSGWKTHLSVHSADVARATDILMDVYQKLGGKVFKVTEPAKTLELSDPATARKHDGKIFTLYDAGEKNWPQIVTEIERRFEQAQIKPGLPVIEDVRVPGATYSFRRNDRDPNGAYVSQEVAKRTNPADPANPFGQPDPMAGFDLKQAAAKPVPSSTPRNLIAAQTWMPMMSSQGETVIGADASGMKFSEHAAVVKALRAEGIQAVVAYNDQREGFCIQVNTKDFKALDAILKASSGAQSAPAKTPTALKARTGL